MLDRTTGQPRTAEMSSQLHPLAVPVAIDRRAQLACLVGAAIIACAAPGHAENPTPPATGGVAATTDIGAALTPLVEPIKSRRVVRHGLIRADVWLISELGFDDTATRVQKAISTQMELSGGFKLARWTYIDADRSYRLDVTGPRAVRVRLTKHLQGTLWELESQGDVREAGKWAPPFRPRPIPLFHGPLR